MEKVNLPKRILNSDAGLRFINWFIANYLRVIERVVRWKRDFHPEADALINGEKSFIACFWHGRMVMMSSAWKSPPQRMHLLISTHRDGMMIAGVIVRRGYQKIEGSSGKGGVQAFREMARLLRNRQVVAITPDGPRGPRMRVKAGALKAAQLSGVPIVPIAGSAHSCWMLRSWDRFMIPKPWTRGALLAGRPIEVPRDLSAEAFEQKRLELENELLRLSRKADECVDRTPVAPDPIEPASTKA